MKFLPALVALLAVALLFPSKSLGAGKKKSTPIPAPDTSDRIIALHLTSITINFYATRAAKEYKLTPATKITVNGQASQLSGLATGMSVIVTPSPDGVTAVTVEAKTARR